MLKRMERPGAVTAMIAHACYAAALSGVIRVNEVLYASGALSAAEIAESI